MTPTDAISLHRWETVEDWGFWILFVGCLCEAAIELISRRTDSHAREASLKRLAVAFGFLVVIGLFLEFWGHGRALDLRDAEISRLASETAAANLRAASLEKEAATARLEAARIKSSLAWRELTPDVDRRLKLALLGHAGTVTIAWTTDDSEAQNLALQLGDAFATARWVVRSGGGRTYSPPPIYDVVVDGTGPEAVAVRKAFTEAHIIFSNGPLPQPIVSYGGDSTPSSVTVMIGNKRSHL